MNLCLEIVFVFVPHTCGGVNNSISFFPAEQIGGADCSDRIVLRRCNSKQATIGADGIPEVTISANGF